MDERWKQLLAGYVDNELTPVEKLEFERELSTNAELQLELKEFNRLKLVTSQMKYADPPRRSMGAYWQSVYRKIERAPGGYWPRWERLSCWYSESLKHFFETIYRSGLSALA